MARDRTCFGRHPYTIPPVNPNFPNPTLPPSPIPTTSTTASQTPPRYLHPTNQIPPVAVPKVVLSARGQKLIPHVPANAVELRVFVAACEC